MTGPGKVNLPEVHEAGRVETVVLPIERELVDDVARIDWTGRVDFMELFDCNSQVDLSLPKGFFGLKVELNIEGHGEKHFWHSRPDLLEFLLEHEPKE